MFRRAQRNMHRPTADSFWLTMELCTEPSKDRAAQLQDQTFPCGPGSFQDGVRLHLAGPWKGGWHWLEAKLY